MDQIVAKVDLNVVLERVDVEALVERTELGAIITKATTGVAGEALDAARSAGVGLDGLVHRWVDRLLRRPLDQPHGPPHHLPDVVEARGDMTSRADPDRLVDLQGTYAGFVTRFGGFVIDILVIGALFALAGQALDYLVTAVTGDPSRWPTSRSSPASPSWHGPSSTAPTHSRSEAGPSAWPSSASGQSEPTVQTSVRDEPRRACSCSRSASSCSDSGSC